MTGKHIRVLFTEKEAIEAARGIHSHWLRMARGKASGAAARAERKIRQALALERAGYDPIGKVKGIDDAGEAN